MTPAEFELATADLIARLGDRDIAEVAETATSPFVRGAATIEKIRRDGRGRKRSAA